MEYYSVIKKNEVGTYLVVQWSRFSTFTAEGPGSIPSWGPKITGAVWHGLKR